MLTERQRYPAFYSQLDTKITYWIGKRIARSRCDQKSPSASPLIPHECRKYYRVVPQVVQMSINLHMELLGTNELSLKFEDRFPNLESDVLKRSHERWHDIALNFVKFRVPRNSQNDDDWRIRVLSSFSFFETGIPRSPSISFSILLISHIYIRVYAAWCFSFVMRRVVASTISRLLLAT